MKVLELLIPTKRGHSISAHRFSCELENGKSLIITSATGVLKSYYGKFAEHFASLGYIVYIFDYHGIGDSDSKIRKLKKNGSSAKSWGNNDQAAVVAYAKQQNPNHKLILIAHSIGGQLLGFNPNYKLLDKVILIASQTGYYKYFGGFNRLKMWLFWHAILPWPTQWYGYFPAKKLGLFENLPKEVAKEWNAWGKKKNYLMHFYDPKTYFFDKLTIPLFSLSFPKDNFAPKKAVDWLSEQYVNAKVERLHYIPKKEELNKLKHFGFFKERFKDSLWTQTHEWIHK